jgi:hypothetical protein
MTLDSQTWNAITLLLILGFAVVAIPNRYV